MSKKYDVFLGGTTNDSTWRDELIEKIAEKNKAINCFNPVVEDWTPDCIDEEERVKLEAPIHVYVITPNMIGPYSVAELIQSTRTKEVLFCILDSDTLKNGEATKWDPRVRKSLDAVSKMAQLNGALDCRNIDTLARCVAALSYIM